MTIAILCGGSGTRLWPLSRKFMPKQFINLFGGEGGNSLFAQTLKRNQALQSKIQNLKILTITNQEQYFLAQDQSEEIGIKIDEFILESCPKNTAPALIFSALSQDEEEIILVVPSDHIIRESKEYQDAILEAHKLAQQGFIVTFGITPSYPHTGYGYIKSNGIEVEGFFEKPSIQIAEQYYRDGGYLWNSGMFCFKAKTLLEELKIHAPKLLDQATEVYKNATKEGRYTRVQDMQNLEEISIDYALMEKTKIAKVIKCDFGWNDVGSFDSLKEEFSSDEDGNSHSGNLISKESKNNLVISKKLVATLGVEDLVVVDTKDALLISKKGQTQKVKDILSLIKNDDLANFHYKVYRPWGSYEVLEVGNGYKIKKIIVKPQKRLSLQKHFHRNEHWIILEGSAEITVGEKTFTMTQNQSTYIPMGEVHRLKNPGKMDLCILEAQVGSYLGEDDIVRLEDDFFRK